MSAPTLRQRFEEWARDEAGLDIRHADSDSPLSRPRYESRDTALAWEAWTASSYETWAACRPPQRELRVRDPCAHTPGPWRADDEGSICSADGRLICVEPSVRGVRDLNQRNANAAMIAAAPTMLSALQMIVAQAVPGDIFDSIARAAIAKAEGA